MYDDDLDLEISVLSNTQAKNIQDNDKIDINNEKNNTFDANSLLGLKTPRIELMKLKISPNDSYYTCELTQKKVKLKNTCFDSNFARSDKKCQRCDQIFEDVDTLIDHQTIVFETLEKNGDIPLKCCALCSFKSCNMLGKFSKNIF